MSRHGTILDPSTTTRRLEIGTEVTDAIDAWNAGAYTGYPWPRSKWLSDLETELRVFYPQASSRDLNLTARAFAPFPLKERP